MSIKIENDVRDLIIGGDLEVLVEVLEQIKNKEMELSNSLKKDGKQVEEGNKENSPKEKIDSKNLL